MIAEVNQPFLEVSFFFAQPPDHIVLLAARERDFLLV